MMTNHVPGSAGFPAFGDKSYEFYSDPITFVNGHMYKHGSRIFLSRLLNKPTVFIGSNKGIREVLSEHGHCIELGYRSFMHDVLGENILFVDGEEATFLRQILMQILSHESFQNFEGIVEKCVQKSLDNIDTSSPMCVYEFFKKLTTEICLSIFLHIDFETSEKLASEVVHLTTEHWHGIISVPLHLRIPFLNSTSTFTKALEAKKKLLEIIDEKLHNNSGGFPNLMRNNFGDMSQARNHLLVFTTALVPKALASVLTSFVISTAGKTDLIDDCLRDCTILEDILLEVERLWPPFIGGRRLIRKDCQVEGYKLHKGHAILYVTQAAHRDPVVFPQPDEFRPERWKHENANDKDKLFAFGLGHRCCIGRKFVLDIIKHILTPVCKGYDWELSSPGAEIEYKWMPVSRPKDGALLKLTRKVASESS